MSDVPPQRGSLPPIVDGWLGKYSATSQAAYRQAVRHWCLWVGDFELGVAVLAVASRSSDDSLTTVLRWYRTVLANEDRSPAKVRQHMAALRSFAGYLEGNEARANSTAEQGAKRWLAAREWQKLVAHTSVGHPAILAETQVSRLLALTSDPRDEAILALILFHRLRPEVVSQLDLDDTTDWRLDSSDEMEARDSESRPAWQSGLERRLVKSVRQVDYEGQAGSPVINRFPLRRAIKRPLEAWLEERGREPGPLFTNRDRAGKGGRLTTRSINRIVHDAGARIGRPDLNPRLLRRAGQPGRRRVGRLVERIAVRRQGERDASLADFDPNVRWGFVEVPESTRPWRQHPPWAWRDPTVRLEFATEIRDLVTRQVERGFRSAESWRDLMALLESQVEGFQPGVTPSAPPAERPRKRRRRALYAR